MSETALKQDQKGRFLPGNKGGGRPKGSKNKLIELFWSDFVVVWDESGIDAMRRVAAEDPGKFLTVAASIMPKDVNLNATFTDMTDEQLESRIANLARQFGDALGIAAGDGGAPHGEEAALRPDALN